MPVPLVPVDALLLHILVCHHLPHNQLRVLTTVLPSGPTELVQAQPRIGGGE